MRKGKNIIGNDVLSLADGRRLESVKDVIVSPDQTAIVALLVDEGGLLSSSRVVPVDRVHSLGKDAVVVADSGSVIPASADERLAAAMASKEKLIGKKVVTESGETHGTVSDIYFDESTGTILGLEVTGGIFKDAARGNSYLPVEDISRSGPDVIFIREETLEVLESQVGGVQGAVQGAGERVAGAASDARGRLAQSTGAVGGRLEESHPEERLLGRRAGRDVSDETGNIIVAAGQRIRAEHVEQARQKNVLQELTTAATVGTGQEAKEQAAEAAGTVGDAAGSLWDRFTRKMSEMTDATGQRVDEAQTRRRLQDIEDAIGRPVTKVILDRQDDVILNYGDLITHQAVQRAFEAGQLDSLLGCVYKAEAAFTPEQLRAPTEAAATIEKATGDAAIVDEMEQRLLHAEWDREQQKEQSRAQAEEERQQREQEREQRAQERQQAAQQRTAEAEEAKATKAELQTAQADPQPEREPEAPPEPGAREDTATVMTFVPDTGERRQDSSKSGR